MGRAHARNEFSDSAIYCLLLCRVIKHNGFDNQIQTANGLHSMCTLYVRDAFAMHILYVSSIEIDSERVNSRMCL